MAFSAGSQNKNTFFSKLNKHKFALLLLIPGLILIFMFSYVPIYGILLAFKKFDFSAGIWGSPWAGLEYFREFISRSDFWHVFRNTIFISVIRIIVEFPAPIIFAVLLNEIRINRYKKLVQSVMCFPFFLSWVVMYAIIQNMLSVDRGAVNFLLESLGHERYNFLTHNASWLVTLFASSIWKNVGYSSILYLAAITKIDVELYDAAEIDGANRFGKMIHVTIPGMQVMILTVLILVTANALNAGFDQIYNLANNAVWDVADIFDTFVIREGLSRANFSMATAAGLFKSVISLVILLTVNRISIKTRNVGIYS